MTCCCITNHPKTWWCNTVTICYLAYESAIWSGLRRDISFLLHAALAGGSSGDALPRWLTHMASKAAVSSPPNGSLTVWLRFPHGMVARCEEQVSQDTVNSLSPGSETSTVPLPSYSIGQAVPESRFKGQGHRLPC